MDVNHLVSCLQNTLNTDKNIRNAAEKQLNQLEGSNGCAAVLLQIMTSKEVDDWMRLAASIAFKRIVTSRWEPRKYSADGTPTNSRKFDGLPEEEKQFIRDNIIEAIVFAPPKAKLQIGLCIRTIAESDFPSKWNALPQQILQYLHSNDQGRIYGALLALRNTVWIYPFHPMTKTKEAKVLDELVSLLFPTLLALFNSLVNVDTVDAHEIIKMMVRIFQICFHFGVPSIFSDNNVLLNWMSNMLTVLKRNSVYPNEPKFPEERKNFPTWKCKKWIAFVFTWIFQRFGDPTFSDKKFAQFSKNFFEVYAAKLLETFIELLKNHRFNGVYLPDRLANEALEFIDTAILRNSMFKIIKPHVDQLFREIVFPWLMMTEEQEQLIAEDPREYLRKEFDIYEEFHSPKQYAINITVDLCTKRAKEHLHPTMSFVANILTRCQSVPSPKEKEACMIILGSIGDKLKKTPVYENELENMIVQHIFPEFKNPIGYVRSRAAWTFSQYFDVDWKNPQNFLNGLSLTLHNLNDPEMIVRVNSALALRFLMQSDLSTEEIRKVLPQLLSVLMAIMNQVEFDDMVNCMELIVEKYSDDMGPYAYSMIENIIQSFWRISQSEDNDDENDSLVALECLGAIQTILDSVSKSPALFVQLENILFPFLCKLLEPDCMEYLEEALKILSFVVHYSPSISPNMWSIFNKLCAIPGTFGIDFISDLLIPFDNYVTRATDVFLASGYIEPLFALYRSCLTDENIEEPYRIEATKIPQILMLNCRGRVDNWIEALLELSYEAQKIADGTELKVSLAGVFANAVYYNPGLALQISQKRNWTVDLFTAWGRLVDKLARAYEKKLSILALSSLLELNLASLPPVVQMGMKQIISQILRLIITLEEQVTQIAEKRKERQQIEDNLGTGDDDEDDEEGENLEDLVEQVQAARGEMVSIDDDEEGDEHDVDVDNYYDSDEDDLDDSSALDTVDEAIRFVELLMNQSKSDPVAYQQLYAQFDQNMLADLQLVYKKAEQRKIQQLQQSK